MGEYPIIEEVDLTGQRTFMRVDFNVLGTDGSMGSKNRIIAALPSIRYAIKQGARLVLATHVQRPDGQVVDKWRTTKIRTALEAELGGKKVGYVDDCVGSKVESAVGQMKNGDVLLLENLRFYAGEEANDPDFVQRLARFVDVYVLDGFAVAHRAHASTVGLPLYLIGQGKEVAAGYLMQQELDYWGPLIGGKHGVAIVGGAKLKEKMLAVGGKPKKGIEGLPSMFDHVVVGGVVANVFLKASNVSIGASVYTEKDEDTGEQKEYTSEAQSALTRYPNIVLPKRVVLDNHKIVNVGNIPPDRSTADALLEEATLQAIRDAPRVAIFGTMGRFEDGYTQGLNQVVAALSGYNGLLKVGGGDAEKAFKGRLNVAMSTGGGASIEYILIGTLPGLEALKGNTSYFAVKK